MGVNLAMILVEEIIEREEQNFEPRRRGQRSRLGA